MNTKSFILITFLAFFAICSQGQTKQDSISPIEQVSVSENQQIEKKAANQSVELQSYKLFPTQNYWTFIKLDTRNGKMWQVHFSISNDGYQGQLILNSSSLLWSEEEEVNGRFTLYPTTNIYNFILLDQINGKTYQVQWNNDKEKRFVSRIY